MRIMSTAINRFGTDNQLPHAVNRVAFTLYRQVRVSQSASIKQLRRDYGMADFFRFTVNVRVTEEPFIRPCLFPPVQADNDDMDVRLTPRVRPQAKVRWAKAISSLQRSNRTGQSCPTCSPWVMELVETKPIRAAPVLTYSPALINQAVT